MRKTTRAYPSNFPGDQRKIALLNEAWWQQYLQVSASSAARFAA